MNRSNPIRVAICDDHRIVADGIRSLLRDLPEFLVVGEAEDGPGLMTLLQVLTVDVVLMDINLRSENGIDLTRRVLKEHPGIHVLGLTMRTDLPSVRDLFAAGAKGYLLKNTDVEELCLAIRTVHEGGTFTGREIEDIMQHTRSDKGPEGHDLNAREHAILQLLSDGYTTRSIADRIFLSEETVKWYRKNLLARFDQPNVAALVKWAVREGLVK
ncbi:MAG: response regulator transcription factor [Flavobacteriales bacterium]|jgi:DNA-binding NarL/FixJ family response regulator|nr:MAG: response regulator transcription factor [Flavobacteriales bacterium]